jgi:hypothetical protein
MAQPIDFYEVVMKVIKLRTTVAENRTVTVALPADLPPSEYEVIVIVDKPEPLKPTNFPFPVFDLPINAIKLPLNGNELEDRQGNKFKLTTPLEYELLDQIIRLKSFFELLKINFSEAIAEIESLVKAGHATPEQKDWLAKLAENQRQVEYALRIGL